MVEFGKIYENVAIPAEKQTGRKKTKGRVLLETMPVGGVVYFTMPEKSTTVAKIAAIKKLMPGRAYDVHTLVDEGGKYIGVWRTA